MKKALQLCALILGSLFSTQESLADASQEISVAGIFDLSAGAGSVWGQTERNSFLLAIADFEAKYKDIKVKVTLEDSHYSNTDSVKAIQKLISVDKIKLFVGPTWEVFSAIIPVCEIRKAICFAPSHNSVEFDNNMLKYSFSAWFDEREYALAHANKLNSDNYKHTVLLTGTSAYYEALYVSMDSALKSKPVFSAKVLSDEKDFRSLITKIPSNVDSLAIFLLGDGAAQSFFKQWAEIRKDRPDVFTDDAVAYFDPPLNLKSLGFKVFYSAPELKSDLLEDYSRRYKERFGQEPASPSGPVAYDETMILLNCARDSLPDTEKVRNCVAKTENYRGVSGLISFGGKQTSTGRKMTVYKLEK